MKAVKSPVADILLSVRESLADRIMTSSEPIKPRQPLRVGFILSKSFTLSAFALFVDTLRLASDDEDRSTRKNCDWQILSAHGHFIRSSCGVQIAPGTGLPAPREFDYLAVVGGLLNVENPIDGEMERYLKRAINEKVKVIGVCTGSFILAQAGLMKNRTACVSWLHHHDYLDRFPDHRLVSNQLYVEDRDIITCAGGSAVADLAASLVRRHIGNTAEKNALQILQIERRREGREIQPRNPLSTEHKDSKMRLALIFMENNLDKPVSMDDVAKSMNLSRRQMERLFHRRLKMSPGAVYARLRMRRARSLVLQTSKPLIDIALEVGFANSSHFGRRFRQTFGCTPNVLRSRQKDNGFVHLDDDLFAGIEQTQ